MLEHVRTPAFVAKAAGKRDVQTAPEKNFLDVMCCDRSCHMFDLSMRRQRRALRR